MNILIAPNSMKGSLSTFDFADTVEKALLDLNAGFTVRKIPIADGGDLTGEVLARSLGAQSKVLEVTDPRGRKVGSKYAVVGKTAIIEMADASGMKLLLPSELNPMLTSSFGTGELIRDAIKSGCSEIYLAIGGSATVDGGLGMLRALGFLLLDELGKELAGTGADLLRIKKIQKSDVLDKVQIRIICDVDNPLLGKQGAAAVFGPQKGASPEMLNSLESGLKNFSDLLQKLSGRDLKDLKGMGAAGGLALPLLAFSDAEIVPGADFICELLEVEKAIEWADLVITGEGKIDRQTLNNKAPFVVSRLARKHKKPVIAIGGKVEAEASAAFDGCFSLANGPMTIDDAMANAAEHVYQTATELGKLIAALRK